MSQRHHTATASQVAARIAYYQGRNLSEADAIKHALCEFNKATLAAVYGPAIFMGQPDKARAVRQAMRMTIPEIVRAAVHMATRTGRGRWVPA